MESYISISKINDFLYSPESLYLHSVYESFVSNLYHEAPQKIGSLNHKNITEGRYTTAKRFFQGIPVYSVKYNIGGKIDLYDQKTKTLIERKTKVKKIYDGQRFQLYAQMFALEEAGYQVQHLRIHSLQDNKRYDIPLPDRTEVKRFEQVLTNIRSYDPLKPDPLDYRSDLSIYRHLGY